MILITRGKSDVHLGYFQDILGGGVLIFLLIYSPFLPPSILWLYSQFSCMSYSDFILVGIQSLLFNIAVGNTGFKTSMLSACHRDITIDDFGQCPQCLLIELKVGILAPSEF